MTDTTTARDDEKLYLVTETNERLKVDFQPSKLAWEYNNGQKPLPRRPLVRFDTSTMTIHTYPLKTGPSMSTMGPKIRPRGRNRL